VHQITYSTVHIMVIDIWKFEKDL